MRISAIHIYPVKGCRGIALETAALDHLGLDGDRRFMIVTPAGKFLTQRTHPRLALIATALTTRALTLTAPALPPLYIPRRAPAGAAPQTLAVQIWKDQNLTAEDCGPEAAAWLATHLAEPARLVRIGENFHRPVKPSKAQPGDLVAFADSHPLLVISEASLAALNTRLAAAGEPPVPMDRFRPNLVITGCDAHAEDNATRLLVNDASAPPAGAITLRAAGPCARCIVTTIDQQTAARTAPEPLRTLATYRRDPAKPADINFGQNYIHETKTGALRTGATLTPLA